MAQEKLFLNPIETYAGYYHSPIGPLTILTTATALVGIQWGIHKHLNNRSLPLQNQIFQQLDEFFKSQRQDFDLPISLLHGTPFQISVWQALTTIPFGTTQTYQQIAQKVNCPKGMRAVGQAIHNNPIPIIIPCHRVIGKNKRLTGYAAGIAKKRYLLELEGQVLSA